MQSQIIGHCICYDHFSPLCLDPPQSFCPKGWLCTRHPCPYLRTPRARGWASRERNSLPRQIFSIQSKFEDKDIKAKILWKISISQYHPTSYLALRSRSEYWIWKFQRSSASWDGLWRKTWSKDQIRVWKWNNRSTKKYRISQKAAKKRRQRGLVSLFYHSHAHKPNISLQNRGWWIAAGIQRVDVVDARIMVM